MPAPQVRSETHPDTDSWYQNNQPLLTWDLPTGATSVRLLLSDRPQATPSVVHTPPINSRQLDPLDDGIWYFHIQLRNNVGWGSVGHFRMQIDSQNPDYFNVRQQIEEDASNPTRSFYFDASDSGSGISHYEVQIDNELPHIWEDDGGHIYQTPILDPGRHTIIFKAFDKAGNHLTQTAEFTIEPLQAPVISQYSKFITSNNPFVIRGETYPNSQVIIWLQREAAEPKSYLVRSDENGQFIFLADEKLKDGVYKFWAQTIDSRGAKSEFSEKLTTVVEPSKLWRLGHLTVDILSLLIPTIALLFLLVLFALRMQLKLRSMKSRLRKETGEAHQAFHQGVDYLKDLYGQNSKLLAKYLAKQKLTKKEMKDLEKLNAKLDSAIKRIDKEIVDIEKELE